MEADFLVVAITPPQPSPGLEARVERMLESGAVDRVHVRFPGYDLREFVGRLKADLLPRISVHAPKEVAQQLGVNCHGPYKGAKSCSCHSIEEIKCCSEHDYIFLSPVFDSISKPGYKAAVPMHTPELGNALQASKVVALGGVTGVRLAELSRAGFAGAALLGWLDVDGEELDGRLEILSTFKRERKKFMNNVRFQFITDSPTVQGTTEQALRVLEGGCKWVQVRMKRVSDKQELGKALDSIYPLFRSKGATLIVDDYVELAAFCDGVHLGRTDMTPSEARTIVGPQKIIGYTVNNPADAKVAAKADVDYVGMGPWRFTTTKRNLAATLGSEGFKSLLDSLRRNGCLVPVVAIGGIIPADVKEVFAAGADGVAVSGAIGRADNPLKETEKFTTELNKTGHRNN